MLQNSQFIRNKCYTMDETSQNILKGSTAFSLPNSQPVQVEKYSKSYLFISKFSNGAEQITEFPWVTVFSRGAIWKFQFIWMAFSLLLTAKLSLVFSVSETFSHVRVINTQRARLIIEYRRRKGLFRKLQSKPISILRTSTLLM